MMITGGACQEKQQRDLHLSKSPQHQPIIIIIACVHVLSGVQTTATPPPPQPLPVFAPTPDRNTKSPDAESEYPTTLTHAGNRFLQEMCTQLERRSRQLDTARQHFHVTNGLQPNIFVLVVRQCAARAPTLIIHRHYPRNEHQLETKATRRPVDNV